MAAPTTPKTGKAAETRLRDRLDGAEIPSEAWQPEPGDELLGVFTGWTSGTTRRKETHPIALVTTETGRTVAVWTFYRVLRDELEEANPKPGETVLIRRFEDRKGPNGKYRVYRVAIDREAAAPLDQGAPGDWTLAEGGAR